ncbi:M3 family metallopeptidase [Aliiglaciecola sp. 2_MG-2023]|uniref:M3 family metallopeptidase n=1 Tax=Alteromonadaceae TaxID=72275 RepID=UPI0026E2E818|nr:MULTISPECIES: M3 family metallopeptidase [unclassified Aliiglaciecola]MDO6709594.1 M3 family metallopeptidase [Aliiglaciecola sp. 2_MG-2023]MDO6750864.1 M3 family metallopeptidase [Aliiglaciecola sp. 1_MG-2023]
MKKFALTLTSAMLIATLGGCSQSTTPTKTEDKTSMTEQVAQETNPLLAEYSGPYGGVPAFDKMDLALLVPALEKGMEINLAEVDAIINNPEAPTFENTIVPLEKSGAELGRVFTYWGIWSSNKNSPEFREIQKEMVPKISAFSSKINQNEKLFARVKAVYEGEEYKQLNSEQQRVTWLTYNGFARNGATLEGEAKKRYAEINQEVASLQTKFANNVLADEENYVLYIDADQLSGLPESFVTGAASAAAQRGHEGKYAITNTRSSMDPFLTYSEERELRKKVWETYYSRGNNGDEYDNNELIKQILKLRHERVQLLGYENYSQWRLEDRMAKNPENAMDLMQKVWPAAIARVDEEVKDMQAVADAENANITIEPWDYRFYAEKVRKQKYDLDSDQVKQYLQLDKLREAMFYVAGRLFNFKFTPIEEGKVPVFHPDVKVWEVTDLTSGEHIGLWYLDPFARTGKRSGAWATTYRSYTTFDGKKTVLSSNNSNFVKGPEGEPTLISWDDAETYFHEFGHALHFLSAKVAYPTSHSGVRDYTEFQSQLLERWLITDEVINNYLVHYKTGEPIPQELVAKIKKASTFNEGFKTTEYMASAIMDLLYHTTDPAAIDPQKFEQEQLVKLGMPEEMVMRHRSTQFGHIFSSEGYASSYYGYMWAEVLTSDAAEAFAEAPGGFYDKELSEKLVKHLFAIRNAMDPAEAYRLFRGRDANVEALMRDRGFPVK